MAKRVTRGPADGKGMGRKRGAAAKETSTAGIIDEIIAGTADEKTDGAVTGKERAGGADEKEREMLPGALPETLPKTPPNFEEAFVSPRHTIPRRVSRRPKKKMILFALLFGAGGILLTAALLISMDLLFKPVAVLSDPSKNGKIKNDIVQLRGEIQLLYEKRNSLLAEQRKLKTALNKIQEYLSESEPGINK